MNELGAGVILVVMALSLGALYVNYLRPTDTIGSWAENRGFTIHTSTEVGWEEEIPGIEILTKGSGRHTVLHVEGEVAGHYLICLDYRYGWGEDSREHCIVAVAPNRPVIPLKIRHERFFDSVKEFIGHDDINFESAEFNRRFHVTSVNRKWAYHVIDQRMMDLLLELNLDRMTVEFGEAAIAIHGEGKLDPWTCDRSIEIALKILELIPEGDPTSPEGV